MCECDDSSCVACSLFHCELLLYRVSIYVRVESLSNHQMRTTDNHFLHKLQFSLFLDMYAQYENNTQRNCKKKKTETKKKKKGRETGKISFSGLVIVQIFFFRN